MGKEKATVSRGIYAGIMDPDTGKILLTRRIKSDSIIPGISFKGNWEIPGGAIMGSDDPSVPYNYYLKELTRVVQEKTGASIVLRGLPVMHSVFFKGPAGYDEASVVPVTAFIRPTVGETIYVSPDELMALAEEFEPANEKTGRSGKGLLSGKGKRMHCMALAALIRSPNQIYAAQATIMLKAITWTWS
ncbi:MAG: hypothetical protein NTZ84_02535 [Candidatus Nealsonbacteria bacterium]|nr:hypothetical protein [Candidatus Nealsonbacteria bacterium]